MKHTTSDAIAESLKQCGLENAFGVIGGPIAFFVVNLQNKGVPVYHFKHETGAAFAAIEASLASQKPQLLFLTTGPGITNGLTGILSARSEGAKLVVFTGLSARRERGRFVSQDTSYHSFARTLFGNDSLFDFSAVVEHEDDLAIALRRIEQGLQRSSGFVAHIAIPAAMQRAFLNQPLPARTFSLDEPGISEHTTKRCIDKLTSGPFAIWAGHGALGA